ncbi:hypothetical protein ZEAMMB73_Zm00001d006487 [Zea mays]|uniref:Uncharacterized protein n=1 Tax=Zea mays TaxID=4577 RepID=A0A1D6EX06_MAIZE|nr:hypothetical protein ZEAMMB73_Zm00001d006487 [Zea mays]
MSAFSVTNRVFSILSLLTSHGRQASVPSIMLNYPQQQLLKQDDAFGSIATQDSPATSFAMLSTSTKQENKIVDKHDDELMNNDLPSPPKKYVTE